MLKCGENTELRMIKICPQSDDERSRQQVKDAVKILLKRGWVRLLLHYSDGSALLRPMTAEEIQSRAMASLDVLHLNHDSRKI